MKTVLSGILMFMALFATAQEGDSLPVPLQYCLLTVSNPPGARPEIIIEPGPDSTFLTTWKEKGFFDEQDRAQKFTSISDALTWIEGQGWDFVSVFTNPGEERYMSHYLMRKKLP